jgi:maltose alpha-D-glucosyltransferase/alpha-amylase
MQSDVTESGMVFADDPLWYQNAIIYELHIRAFADSNGDGIGDFRGLIGKLDYLQDLGVSALWVLPFYPSPLRDDGYDIANYTAVNPAYGTLADFQTFLEEAHRRGLRVITELVLNHTSDQHPWFQRARHAPPGSPERDFYVWNDNARKYAEARIIFKDFETSNWTWDPVANAYFWHRFYSHQPDLNYDNPAVHEATFQVLDFWLSKGVDGLRLDAVPYLYEREGTNCENLPETHAYLKKLRQHVDEKFLNRMLLAEANQWPEDAAAYFGAGDECHMNFHFPVMPRLFMAVRTEDRFPIVDILQQTPPIPPTCQWATFLRNHDELTLEMVTDEDRDSMYRFYAQDPQARINLGIRRRLAPLLENHRGKIELLNALLLSLPGTPVLYYGDEIGMGDNIYLGDRNGVRTPMQWSGERNAGFSKANPQRLYFPVIIDPEYHYEAVNVEAQEKNPHSLLWWMKRLLALRKRYQAFGRGSLEFVTADNARVLTFLRRFPVARAKEDGGESGGSQAARPQAAEGPTPEYILVVANLSRHAQCVVLDLSEFQGYVPVEMLGRTRFPVVGGQPYQITLGSYAFYWFSLEPQRAGAVTGGGVDSLPRITVPGRWEELLYGEGRESLEEVLPGYLPRSYWFQDGERTTEAVHLLQSVAVTADGVNAWLALAQVEYGESDTETFVLPLAFATGPEADRLLNQYPRAVVARLKLKLKKPAESKYGVLYDPLADKAYAQGLVEAIVQGKRFDGHAGQLVATALPALAPLHDPAAPVPEILSLRVYHQDTLAACGDRLLLRVCRRVEPGIDPEVEVSQALLEKTGFRSFLPVVGTLEYREDGGRVWTLATLKANQAAPGDAWQHTRDSLGRYYEHALTHKDQGVQLPLERQSWFELIEQEPPALAREVFGVYLEHVRLLGQRTAEYHIALASITDVPDFAPEPFTTLVQRSIYQSLRTQARQTLELLRKRVRGLPEAVQPLGRELLGREDELLGYARRVYERKITAQQIRCHGDYHLARVLYTGNDFVLLDLEGAPGRPVSARRRKRSPLRDVGTMLCSFHYAALAAARHGAVRQEDYAALGPWIHFWRRWVAVTYLKAYLAAAAGQAFLPRAREELENLLRFYLLKRATNELRDDLLTHLDRAEVPLQFLLQVMEASR